MKKLSLDKAKLSALYDENSQEVVDNVMKHVVELAVSLKFGPGIIKQAQLPEADVEAIYRAFAPLKSTLVYESYMSHIRVWAGTLSEPNLREYLLRTTAGILGKAGGRKPRARSKHLEWLEHTMRRTENQNKDKFPRLKAKEHFAEIKALDAIDSIGNDGDLVFNDRLGDQFCIRGTAPTITMKMVSTMLTRIRKGH